MPEQFNVADAYYEDEGAAEAPETQEGAPQQLQLSPEEVSEITNLAGSGDYASIGQMVAGKLGLSSEPAQ